MKSGKVIVVEYGPFEDPLGYVECLEQGWIFFWYQDGSATLYPKREKSGAVTGKSIDVGKKRK